MTQACSGKRPLVEWFAETIDCDDADAMADFYAAILDGRVTHRDASFASIEARGLLLNFRAIPDYRPPTWPSSEVPMQSHFELVIEDPDAAATQMRALGARLAAR
jgi:catechol-2,3-dioxygenase